MIDKNVVSSLAYDRLNDAYKDIDLLCAFDMKNLKLLNAKNETARAIKNIVDYQKQLVLHKKKGRK